MPTQLPPKTICLNCNYEVKTENKYCPSCGQENANKRISLRLLLQDAISTAFNFESRVFKTIPLFLFYPGRLTNEFLDGKRVRYMHPFKIYLLSSLLFFFVFIKVFTPTIETAMRNLDKETEDLNVNLTFNDSSSVGDSTEKGFVEGVNDGFDNEINSQDSLEQDTISSEMLEKIKTQQKSITDSLSKIIADVSSGKITNVTVNIDSLESLMEDSAAMAQNIYVFNKKANQKVGGLRRFYRLIQDREMTPEALLDSSTNAKTAMNMQFAEQILKIGRNDPAIFVANIINNIGTFMFFTLPILALFFMPFYFRRKKYYIDHLIFTLHLQAFTFILLTLAALFFYWGLWEISLITFAGLIIYVWFAFKNVYKQGLFKTTIKSYLISLLYLTTLIFMLSINLIYSFLMF